MKQSLTVLLFVFSLSLFSQQPLIDSVVIQRLKDSFTILKKDSVVRDTFWKTNGFIGLNFAQTALSNWQGGGEDNFSILGLFNYEANYKKGDSQWNNKMDAQFGIVRTANAQFWKKNSDQLFFMSQFNLNAFNSKYWFYSLMTDFRSQMAPGYLYSDSARQYISNWAAPAYIQLALGFEFKKEEEFSATLSPLAGKLTIVNDQTFADNGDYGVQAAVRDSTGNVITHGKKLRYEFGGRFTIKLKKDIAKNFNLESYADFFTNYLDHPENIDIVWNTLATLKINKWLSATASVKCVYDNDIIIKYDWNKDGAFTDPKDINGPRPQVMSTFGVGLGYKF